MNTEKFYDRLGSQKLERIAEDFHIDDSDFLSKRLDVKDVILDLGCGYGRVAIPLAMEGYEVYGIDVSSTLIEEAREKVAHLENKPQFTVGDMTVLPYADAFFTKVVCLWNSFSHLLTEELQSQCLKEVCRVLQEGGAAYIILPNGDGEELQKQVRETGSRIIKSTFYGLEIEKYIHDTASLEKLLRENPFASYRIEVIDLDATQRIVVTLTK